MTIRCVHYELTDLCNAGCPQCPRTNPAGCKPEGWLARAVCSLESFRRLSPSGFLQELDSAYFCGNFGDPAVVPELIDILRYCWDAKPTLKLAVHTNASVRSAAWWEALARTAAGHRFRVIAGIDGASHETNRRYRVRTDFARIIDNLAAFIAAGGEAEWRMLVFRHNEHEVDVAERMARDLGFVAFKAYPSNRFAGRDSFGYTHDGEAFVLEPPTKTFASKAPARHMIAPQDVAQTEAVIDCDALRKSSAFINFEGYLLPCCYIGRRLYVHEHGAPEQKDRAIGQVFDSFDMRRLNVEAVGFAAARTAYDAFLEHLEPYWTEQRPQVCKAVCGRRRPLAAS